MAEVLKYPKAVVAKLATWSVVSPATWLLLSDDNVVEAKLFSLLVLKADICEDCNPLRIEEPKLLSCAVVNSTICAVVNARI
jgi:hypothetical protein